MNAFILISFSGLGLGGLYALLASGLSLVFGLMRVLNFAHAATMSACALVAWQIVNHVGSHGTGALVLAIVGAVAAGSGIAVLLEWLVVRPLEGRELEQLLATVGIGIALEAFLQGQFGSDQRAFPLPKWVAGTTNVLGSAVPNSRFVIIGAAIVVFAGIGLFLAKTRHGLIIRAGVENQEMVRALGINMRSSHVLVFGLSGAAAGLAGAMAAIYLTGVSATMGDSLLIYAFIVLVIGGLGSLSGAAIAAVVIGLLQSYANYYQTNGAGDIYAVLAMAVVLLIRPQGILGKKGRLT